MQNDRSDTRTISGAQLAILAEVIARIEMTCGHNPTKKSVVEIVRKIIEEVRNEDL